MKYFITLGQGRIRQRKGKYGLLLSHAALKIRWVSNLNCGLIEGVGLYNLGKYK